MSRDDSNRVLSRRFIVVQPQIVGTADDWDMTFLTDRHESATLQGALGYGLRALDHDDFWVCEMHDGSLTQIWHSDGERRPLDEEEFAQAKETLR